MLLKYLKELIKKLGIVKFSLYIILLIIIYFFYGLLPYFIITIVDLIIASNFNKEFYLYLVLMMLSFTAMPLLRFPNNYFLQLIRKYSKYVLW